MMEMLKMPKNFLEVSEVEMLHLDGGKNLDLRWSKWHPILRKKHKNRLKKFPAVTIKKEL